MKRGITVIVFALLMTALPVFAELFEGTLVFRSGDRVDFTRLGTQYVEGYELMGKMGSQEVKFGFHELKTIVFTSDRQCYCDRKRGGGEVLIESRSGEKYTLTDVYVLVQGRGFISTIGYSYNDPVTKALRQTEAKIMDNIHAIEIGQKVGRLRWNSATETYFPSSYVFDPYTGAKLEWAEDRK